MTTNPADDHTVSVGAAHPCLLGVFCDKCDTTFEGDFLVAEDWTKAQRLDCVRAHVRMKLGWSCDERGDFCPDCRMAEPDSPAAALRRAAKAARELPEHVLPAAIAGYLVPRFERWADAPPASQMTFENQIVKAAVAVLALAEQQARPTPQVARTWLAKELHNAGVCEPGAEQGDQVVCDENCRNLAKMAQDVFLGGPIDWTKEEPDV